MTLQRSIPVPASVPLADASWEAIVRRQGQARALARNGEPEAARALLQESLPDLIRAWGRQSGLPRDLQLLRLRKLLQGDLGNVLRPPRARSPRPAAACSPRLPTGPSRIPLGDISGMIDAVQLAEVHARKTTRPLPLAS